VAFDAFLKIPGIKGDSTDAKHKDEIEIESFSFGVSNSGSAATGGGAGAGRANLQDFSFVAPLTSVGPQMFLACASGKHYSEALFTVRRAGDKSTTDFYKVKFSDILISSYSEGGARSDAAPVDQVSFNFAKIEVSYTRQDAKGAGETTTVAWDQSKDRSP
jgi:type VI secretion system secreted protein Hcp